jgi:hypothetical protein
LPDKIYKKIPNGRKIDQTAIKYTNIFHCKTLQDLPKFWIENKSSGNPGLKTECVEDYGYNSASAFAASSTHATNAEFLLFNEMEMGRIQGSML